MKSKTEKILEYLEDFKKSEEHLDNLLNLINEGKRLSDYSNYKQFLIDYKVKSGKLKDLYQFFEIFSLSKIDDKEQFNFVKSKKKKF